MQLREIDKQCENQPVKDFRIFDFDEILELSLSAEDIVKDSTRLDQIEFNI